MIEHNPLERAIEHTLFASRWLMAPFYLGLVVGLFVLMVKFGEALWHFVPNVLTLTESEVLLGVLALIDLSLAANLLLMVIFAGYENFVSKMDIGEHKDRPEWMGKIDFSAMKLKLIASIVAISGIHLLQRFMQVETIDKTDLMWLVIIHLVFVISGLLLALSDYITVRSGGSTH